MKPCAGGLNHTPSEIDQPASCCRSGCVAECILVHSRTGTPVTMIMTQIMLVAAGRTERRHPLQIADHPGTVVDIIRAAGWAIVQRALVDLLTLVTDGDFHIHAEIITA